MIDTRRVKQLKIQNPARFTDDLSFLDTAIQYATGIVKDNLEHFVHKYPTACSVGLMYEPTINESTYLGSDWTSAFWTGMLWLSYEFTGNELFRAVAEAQYDDYKKRLDEFLVLNHHDIGFLYIPSILAQYKLTGAKKAKKLCLKAADLLSRRYCEKAGIIQVRERNQQGDFIVDCSMNIPLLYWATSATGDRSYYHKALNHITRVANHMVRQDGSTYQCYQIDEVTGDPIRGFFGQGSSDESCWSRGQAWIIYGLALSYKYVKDPALLDIAKKTIHYYLNNLPTDDIANWDLAFTADDVQRDSSASATTICGLLEIIKYLPDEDGDKQTYRNAAISMLRTLAEKYSTKGLHSNGLLQHGVYCKDRGNGGLGDDECCIWGDYFYMEALMRLKKDWNPYW